MNRYAYVMPVLVPYVFYASDDYEAKKVIDEYRTLNNFIGGILYNSRLNVICEFQGN